MLVLTRKAGESIIIGGDIKITVVQLANGRVRLGVEAPANVPVNREEIHDRKAADGDRPAIVAGPADAETAVATAPPALHNRIAGKLPAPPAPRRSADPRKPR